LNVGQQLCLVDFIVVRHRGRAEVCNLRLTVLCVQWREASYTTAGGDVYRVYMVCNVAVTAVDNWLRTPYIARLSANRLYVDVKFTMRRCTKYPDPVRLQQCKESFKVVPSVQHTVVHDMNSSPGRAPTQDRRSTGQLPPSSPLGHRPTCWTCSLGRLPLPLLLNFILSFSFLLFTLSFFLNAGGTYVECPTLFIPA